MKPNEAEKTVPDYSLESDAHAQGYAVVCGTDEAGRGPLCGPVFAAACILDPDRIPPGINDSKKLTARRREILFDEICACAVSYGIASASVEEIDTVNILEASQLAMRRAVAQLDPQPDFVLVDGDKARNFPMTAVPVIGGDAKSLSIAAASILAKVSRDRVCLELDALYPQYGIAKHKGYPTKDHMEAVRQFGPSPCHRKSFLGFLTRKQK